MKRKDLKKSVERITKEMDAITDDKAHSVQAKLLNLVEDCVSEVDTLQSEIRALKDEVNRLKGEQGKPHINRQKKNPKEDSDADKGNGDHSSEKNRKPDKTPRKEKSKKNIKVDSQITCPLNKGNLPNDLEFKGYESKIIQDIIMTTNNIEYQREVYYSPSTNKTYMADLPAGCQGSYGPGIKATVLSLYHDSKMTMPAIERFFSTHTILISQATISRMLTDNHELFHQEKEAIIAAGLQSTPYQHFDDTGARVNGKNHYTHVLCNPFYTAYFTVPKKDRMTVLGILCRGELKFTFNDKSFQMMTDWGLAEKHLSTLKSIISSTVITRAEIDDVIEKLFSVYKRKKHKNNKRIILESAAITFYQSSKYAIDYLVCDDAPQFNNIAKHKALCWVHEGRHYKKLNPIVAHHRTILDDFINKFWGFYQSLLDYKENPCETKEKQLSQQFDTLFSEKTGYEQLDERNAKTFAKKSMLMLVLLFPFLPLHNNPAELGARYQARHRDINLQTKNKKGTDAKDTFATIVQTARKLNVIFFDYLKDRISNKHEMPSLASLIIQQSQPIPDTS